MIDILSNDEKDIIRDMIGGKTDEPNELHNKLYDLVISYKYDEPIELINGLPICERIGALLYLLDNKYKDKKNLLSFMRAAYSNFSDEISLIDKINKEIMDERRELRR